MTNNVLILYAHPAQDRSEVNAPMFQAALNADGVSCIDLYAEYPTHNIDIQREQRRLVEHEVVIFQFPFYWYSTPAILKDWMDLVLEYNFAYGKNGKALDGKYLLPVISAGGAEEAYQEDGYNHFTMRELLRPIEQTSLLCNMKFLSPFVLFGARTAVEEGRVGAHVQKWGELLQSLVEDRFDFVESQKTELLTQNFDAIVNSTVNIAKG